MGNHLIHKQVLDLRYADERRAKTAMNRWGERFEKEWLPVVEEVLDELDQEERWNRLEKVELDLGKISEDLEPEILRDKLKEALKTQLLKQAPELREVREKGKKFNSGQPHEDQKTLELLIYQLQNGRKPWWSSHSRKEGIRTLFNQFLADKDKQFLIWIRSGSFSNEMFERLVNHLESEQIQQLISLAFPEKQKETHSIILSLVSALSPEIHPKTELEASLRNQIAESFLISEKLLKNPFPQWIKTWLIKPKTAFQPTQEALIELLTLLIPADFFRKLQIPALEKVWPKWTLTPLYRNTSTSKTNRKNYNQGEKVKFLEFVKNRSAIQKLTAKEQLTQTKTRNSTPVKLEVDETFLISNSGLVLAAPFLTYFFKGLGLVENKEWVSREAQNRGVLLLQALLDDSYIYEESDVLLNKILCGIDESEPIEVHFSPTEIEKEEIQNLLDAMVTRWTALRSTSGASMAKGFFAREGSLKRMDKGYQLTIHRISIDILLNRLPWTISIIKLPWMEETLYTEW